MPSLKEIQTRIASVQTTRQVTSAMKMVSAAKLKRAQDAIHQIRPYAEKLHEILTTLSASLSNSDESPYTRQREPEKVLILLISSNRGLCGAFNATITKKAIELAQTKYSEQLNKGNVQFLAIGKRGEQILKGLHLKLADNHNELFNQLTFDPVAHIANELMDKFICRDYDRIDLVYNEFKNAAVQIPRTEQYLPVEELPPEENGSKIQNNNFIFEPSEEEIVRELIPRSLRIQLYKALLDSNTAEQGARMTSMHQATDNATELVKELTLTYNKVRQTAITNQIIEVTNGALALEG